MVSSKGEWASGIGGSVIFMGEWAAVRVGEQLYEQDGSEGSDGQLICGRNDEQHKGKVFI